MVRDVSRRASARPGHGEPTRGWFRTMLSAAVVMASVGIGCAPAPITGGGYELVYHDEFDDGVLSGLWQTAPFGGSLPASEADGMMTIAATAANDYHWGYIASTGPRFDGEPSYPLALGWQYGYFEARLRYSDNAWAWPAFWLFSRAKTEAWPGEDCRLLNAEWDIMENGVQNANGDRPASSWNNSVIHRNTTDNTEDGYCGQPDEARGFSQGMPDTNLSHWHTWAGRWTADELCTYLDGELLNCMDPYDTTSQPMHLIFTILYLRECNGCGAAPPRLEMQVDWVRVWQPA
jgi:hypothetical protein